MRPAAPAPGASAAAFIAFLAEPALVLGRDGAVVCVNDAAEHLLGCTAGWSIERLAPAIGDAALGALRGLFGRANGFVSRFGAVLAGATTAGEPLPDAELADGRRAAMAALRLDAQCWAVVLRVAADDARSVTAPVGTGLPVTPVGPAVPDAADEGPARGFDEWFDLMPAGLVLFDDAGRWLRCNGAFEALVGELPASLDAASDGLQQLLAWHDRPALARLAAGSEPLQTQAWLARDGAPPRRLRAVLRAHSAPGRPGCYAAVVEDRSVEEERDLARLQVGALMDTAGVGLATFQESSGWAAPAPAPGAPDHSGEAGAALSSLALQSISRDVVVLESRDAFDALQQALRDGRRCEARYAIRHREHGLRWLLTRVEPATLASGERTTSVVTLDVTEREAAQRRNAELLHELTTILDSTSTGIAYVRGNVLVRCNRRFEQMLRLASGQAAGRSIAELFEDQPRFQLIAHQALRALAVEPAYETEFESRSTLDSAGRPRWFSLSARRAGTAPAGTRPLTSVEAIVVLSDVTRLKSQQRELELLARDRALMFNLSEVGIAFVRQGRIQRANAALAALAGRAADELVHLPHEALFADGGAGDQALRGCDEGALLRHGRRSGERQLRRSDGALRWVQVSQRLVAEGDPTAGVIASYVDIDARRRAEEAVALQAGRTRAILDSVQVGIVTVGPQGIEWMNRSARRMFGGDLTDFLRQPIGTVATPDDGHPFRRTRALDELVEGQAETFECRVKARDGREFWVVGNAVATGGTAGRQLTYALLDIERRRQAEARMAASQDSLQRLIEMAPLAITLCDAKSLRVLHLNPAAAALVERPAAAVVGCAPEDLYQPELAAQLRNDMQVAIGADSLTRKEYTLPGGDGRAQTWDARYLPLGPPGQPAEQLLLVATDVTEQRAAQEERYAAAVAQREMLVKEVHHRIKNNLQGVAGLLQQIGERKPEVAPAIAEAVGQLQAIAQVYGLQVGATTQLALDGVVEAIARSVQRLFGRPIALAIEPGSAARWLLPEGESIPIALSLNELLTNAIKHSARPESAPVASGETAADAQPATAGVSCRLSSEGGGVCLLIGNDGRLPEGFNLARFPGGVSGLGLVRALLPRRSARLDFEQQGTRVQATLRLTPPGVVRAADT